MKLDSIESMFPKHFCVASFVMCAFFAGAVHYFFPVTMPMPDYYRLALALGQGEFIPPSLPLVYTWYLWLGVAVGGMTGVLVLQFLAYYCTVLLGYIVLQRLGCSKSLSIAGCLLVGLHPYLWMNTHRILANVLAVPALLAVVLVVVNFDSFKKNVLRLLLLGGFVALLFNIRGNFVFFPAFFALLILVDQRVSLRTRASNVAIAATGGILLHFSVYVVSTGDLRIFPDIASYNFFLSANPYTEQSLLTTYNIEPSLDQALRHYGITLSNLQTSTTANELAWKFIRENPLQYGKLFLVKFFTLFRPDYRMLGNSQLASFWLLAIVQTLLALPLLLWIIARLLVRRSYALFAKPYVFVIVLLYQLPCLILGADPRYRLPTDVLMLVDVCYCYYLLRLKLNTLSASG